MSAAYVAAREAERCVHEAMTREQLIVALEAALAACRMVDRTVADLKEGLRAAQERIADRDRALEQWAAAFAPARPLGVRYP